MKPSFFLALIFVTSLAAQGQNILNIENFQPELSYENVHSYEIDSDPLASTYLIWVKKSVAPHKHAEHTEVVYVLQGEGKMTFNSGAKNEYSRNIEPGDYIFIPKNTIHSVTVTSGSPMKVLSVQSPQFDGSDRVLIDQ
ncbi:MAG: hypothetical protein Salg2KO_08900 [Salibacteraceae bacterium]